MSTLLLKGVCSWWWLGMSIELWCWERSLTPSHSLHQNICLNILGQYLSDKIIIWEIFILGGGGGGGWFPAFLDPARFHQGCQVSTDMNVLTLMLVMANLANAKLCKKTENDCNPGKWILIWEYSVRAIQWIPTWQGLDVFQKSLHFSALDEGSLSMECVKGGAEDRDLSKHLIYLLTSTLQASPAIM